MNIEDFEIQEETIATVAQGRIQLKGLLDCEEFSQAEYDRQMEEMSKFSDETMSCWCSRVDYSDKFLDNEGSLYYEAETGKVIDFIGYC